MLTERILEMAESHGLNAAEQAICFARAIESAVLAQLPKSREEWVNEAARLATDVYLTAYEYGCSGESAERELATKARNALLSHISTPPVGYVLVPVAPSAEIIQAGLDARKNYGATEDVYRAMVFAAQKDQK